MKGIVFNLLEQVVTERHGEAAWEALLEETRLSGAYTSLGSYPDDEVFSLVGAASEMLSLPPDEVLRWFGRAAMPLLAERFPAFFAPHRNTLSFVRSVNSIIHPEVRKLYAGAACPHFHFSDAPGGGLRIGYDSTRRLCALAHGFIEGAAPQFGEEAVVDHAACMNRGDPRCELTVCTVPMAGSIGNAA